MSLFSGLTGGAAAAGMLNPALAAGMFDLGQQAYFNYQNYQLQQHQFDYAKNLQGQIFGREDNSIQRRVADLLAAGLSPVLAAGQGAGTGGIVSTSAPQMDKLQMTEAALAAMSLLKMDTDITQTRKSTELIQQQIDNMPTTIEAVKANTKATRANARKTNADARKAEVDARNTEVSGVSGSDSMSGILRSIAGMMIKTGDNVSSITNDVQKKQQPKPRGQQPYKPEKKTGYEGRWQ